jgi:subtilisin family serine protease
MTESDRLYSAGTVEHNAKYSPLFSATFSLYGKKSGHGIVGWLPAPAYAMPDAQDWPTPYQPPVIALLDSGVQSHPGLSETEAGEQPFVLDAEDLGWPSPLLFDEDADLTGDYSSHWGHATFIAGLIRRAAPLAQVLSMRVMNRDGKVSEDDVAGALNWLADNPVLTGGVRVDIVLMAFGRPEDPDDKHLEQLRAPIKKLTDRGVRIVASAGNDGAERPVYPAAFATESALSPNSQRSVLSVGAFVGPDRIKAYVGLDPIIEHAPPTERAPYSNFGPWVTDWRTGTNIISIMPLTTTIQHPGPAYGDGYAWWSGTSFAAAAVAGELAAGLPPVPLTLPEPADGS